jgi:hypothetical protein
VRHLVNPLVALSIIIVGLFVTVLAVAVITRKTSRRALIDIIRSEMLFTRSWSMVVVLTLLLAVVAVLVILVLFPD